MQRSPVTPSLYVPSVPQAVRFYVNKLGFQQTAAYQDDDESDIWAEVALGESRIWFFSSPLDGLPEPTFSGLIYVFVDDVDALAKELEGRIDFRWGPETQPYGLRELGISDLNGYLLVFARDT